MFGKKKSPQQRGRENEAKRNRDRRRLADKQEAKEAAKKKRGKR